jgi:hypothetical protein
MATNGDRKSTDSNFGCTLRCEFSPHFFSQSSSDGTVTSTFAKATAGQVGVFRVGMMHRLGIVPQCLLCEPLRVAIDRTQTFASPLQVINSICRGVSSHTSLAQRP